ncbi:MULTISPECIES: STAS domain-containing protein [Leptolyngbya]|uniref:STAS domain-containing protein n=1 Tax=Leptolyngbya TaxID=47251 RepID=UPI001685F85D|nr:STAS domain-containing protein [Leptolyngbya sp. FACHB-1624]MBD1856094.1 STAS domain-containing protein [Leptolyngbya sp. FACHB-1624]
MQFEVTHLDNKIKQVKLIGRLDLKGTNEIDDAFSFAVGSSKTPTLIDMSEVEFIASIGMQMLISNTRSLAKRSSKLVLLNPTPLVREALVTAGFESLIPMYDDFDTACADLQTALVE